jgi:hypothetical protein
LNVGVLEVEAVLVVEEVRQVVCVVAVVAGAAGRIRKDYFGLLK